MVSRRQGCSPYSRRTFATLTFDGPSSAGPVPGTPDPICASGSHRWPKPVGYRWSILRADVRTLLRLHTEALEFRRNATGSS